MNFSKCCITLMALVGTLSVLVPGAVEARADAAQPRVQISAFLSGHTRLYYRIHNRYHALAYQRGVHIINTFTAVRFVNNSRQAIREISFELGAYDNGYRAIAGAGGKPLVKDMVARGAFAPGATQTLVNANTVWTIPAGNGLGCVRMTGLRLVYADGSTASVPESEINRHFIPALSNSCGVPAGRVARNPRHIATGPSPDIPGVYPAKWMTVGLSPRELAGQPFVAPGDTQPLCAVGSFLEENCEREAVPAGQ